jgi:hypothetical protein
MLMFGGGLPYDQAEAEQRNDLWSLSLEPKREAWQELRAEGNVPSPRAGAAMAVDETGHQLVLVGGFRTQGSRARIYDDATYVWDTEAAQSTWRAIANGPGPQARDGGALVQIPPAGATGSAGRMLHFGGERFLDGQDYTAFNDLWLLDLEKGAERWAPVTTCGTPPPARAFASLLLDVASQRLLMLGGTNDSGMWVDGVWALDLAKQPMCWSQLSTRELFTNGVSWPNALLDTCPGARRILVYDGEVVVALNVETGADEAWRTVWEPGDMPVTAPGHRDGPAWVFNPATGDLVLSGGFYFVADAMDAWALHLTSCDGVAPPVSPLYLPHLTRSAGNLVAQYLVR